MVPAATPLLTRTLDVGRIMSEGSERNIVQGGVVKVRSQTLRNNRPWWHTRLMG